MSPNTLFIFGDQSLDLRPSIRDLSTQARENRALRDFMRSATDNIQHALTTIPSHIRPDISPFDCPLQLVEAVERVPGSTPLVSSLLAIAQLGNFIVHLSSHPCALDGSISSPIFLSLCTGSLSAAAIASSRNLTELLQIAPQIVSLAFHVGFQAFRRSQALEESDQSWAVIVRDVDPKDLQPALDNFNERLNDHFHRRVYISAVGESSVTISGPPSVSAKFFDETPSLKSARTIALPIHAAFHAKHLIPVRHSRVFGNVDSRYFNRHIHHSIISPCSGEPYSTSKLDDVLHQILDEIMQQQIDWRAATSSLTDKLDSSATVISMGPFFTSAVFSKFSNPVQNDNQQKPKKSDLRDPHLREGSGAVAIVGMSIRAPGSETLEDFCKTMREGRDLHQHVPADRFNVEAYYGSTGMSKSNLLTPYGVFIDRPGYFDPRFFSMSPREALQTDPQQRLMLLTTYEALENAGYSPNRTPSSNPRRIASFLGQTGDDYREQNANQDVDTYFITGNIRAFGPGRLNYHFGWEGPSFSIDTACSSSGASIQLACSALLSRECDTAVTGGANLLTSPDLFAGLSRGGFLSKTGGCKTFDQDADGYVRGEGCGVIVLKRLEDATADRDNILAVIRGATTNHSAEAVSITHPHQETQERLFQSVLNEAGVLPCDVDVAEIHGTGTQAGDATESRSVINVLCQGRAAGTPLILSTVKPNIGHGEAVSGVTSIIKAVLMMQHNVIPPHIGIKGLVNEKLPTFQDLNVRVCSDEMPFYPRDQGDGKRRVLVNNFDAAGGNTSMLLEDAPLINLSGVDPRKHHVVTFSAKTASALANNISNTLSWLKTQDTLRLEDIAYTSAARRMHHQHRKAFPAASIKELIVALENQGHGEAIRQRPKRTSTVFCFTGQGSQYIYMASTLYQTHPIFRDHINDFAGVCDFHGFPSFLPVIKGDYKAFESPVRTQLSIVAIELALAYLWNSWGIQASAVIGHSLGEYTALCYAGVISTIDCFYLVGKRAEFIEQKCTANTHVMLSVQSSPEKLQHYLNNAQGLEVEIACCNSPRSTVVGGSQKDIELLNEKLRVGGLHTKPLLTKHAFHTSQIDTILDDLEITARRITFTKPHIPVASTGLGEIVYTDKVFNPEYLRLQSRGPVRFQDAVEALYAASIANNETIWMEIGPSPACISMLKATTSGVRTTLPSLQSGRSDWQMLCSSIASAYMAGLDVDWVEFHRPFESSLQLVQLPNYSFDLKNYWIYSKDGISREQSPRFPGPNSNASVGATLFTPTDSLHRIERDESNANEIKIKFVTDASHPKLNKILQGHRVNGVALCPSSVYAEMALMAASHIRRISQTGLDKNIEVDDMKVFKPLIIDSENTDQVIYVTATAQRHVEEVGFQFASWGKSIFQDHASCTVRFADHETSIPRCLKDLQVVKDRIEHLKQAALHGDAHKILRSMVYKLFGAFVKYDPEYQGLMEVHLDTDALEAAADVKLQPHNNNFICNPCWIDSIAHLSGFVLNGTEFTPEDAVFISHGWRSLKLVEGLSTDVKYQSYVCMHQNKRRTIFTGDVYLFHGEKLAAVCQGLEFQQVKREFLNSILPNTTSLAASPKSQDTQLPRSMVSTGLPDETPAAKPASCTQQEKFPAEFKFEQVLHVFANELGVDVCDLDEEAEFSDLGVDSLMTTSVLKTLGAQLGMHLSAADFVECRSLRDLRARFNANSNVPARSSMLGPNTPAAEHENSPPVLGEVLEPNVDFSLVLNVLAQELGTDLPELVDDAYFADLGVDSLLTISILSRLSEVIGQNVPASLFIRCPTVADLRHHFELARQQQSLCPSDTGFGGRQDLNSVESGGLITPATELGDCDDECCLSNRSVTTEVLRKIVAEEIGISTTEIDDDALLTELGVDSLLSLSILTRVKEQTGMVLASTFLTDHPTFSAIERALLHTPMPCPAGMDTAENSTAAASQHSPTNTPLLLCRESVTDMTGTRNWSASSVLLQGSPLCRDPCLFLIPDGSGSPSSYIGLPYLNHTGAVYGLSSPFHNDPGSFNVSLQTLVEMYVVEMVRIQPIGPYHIGGWSVGGICAFEAAALLVRKHGQQTSSLILIDAPCPTILPPLPMEDVDFLQSVGVFETLEVRSKADGAPIVSARSGIRNGVREHFAGSINALKQYNAVAIEESKCPKSVVCLWADYGVWQTLGEEVKALTASGSERQEKHPTTSWLMNPRSNYGTHGWEELLPGSSFTCHNVPGDHFSMTRAPAILELGAKIRSSLSRK